MAYPPPKPRKHPGLTSTEARSHHLQPYRFQSGSSGNPSGMSKSQRETYSEAKALAHQAGPGAIRRLAELAGIPLDGGDWVPLERHDIDPRVVYMAATALAERAYGKPREFDPAEEQRTAPIDFSRLTPEQIEMVHNVARLLAGARAPAQPDQGQ
jgi:hypothetical protein